MRDRLLRLEKCAGNKGRVYPPNYAEYKRYVSKQCGTHPDARCISPVLQYPKTISEKSTLKKEGIALT